VLFRSSLELRCELEEVSRFESDFRSSELLLERDELDVLLGFSSSLTRLESCDDLSVGLSTLCSRFTLSWRLSPDLGRLSPLGDEGAEPLPPFRSLLLSRLELRGSLFICGEEYPDLSSSNFRRLGSFSFSVADGRRSLTCFESVGEVFSFDFDLFGFLSLSSLSSFRFDGLLSPFLGSEDVEFLLLFFRSLPSVSEGSRSDLSVFGRELEVTAASFLPLPLLNDESLFFGVSFSFFMVGGGAGPSSGLESSCGVITGGVLVAEGFLTSFM